MATIRLTNNDLRKMISEAVSRLCEGEWYQAEPLCRLPYFVTINFSDHAIDREYEREINQDMIADNAKKVIHEVIDDYYKRKLRPDSYFKIIDRDTCIVAVFGISPTYNKKRIHQIVVVTCYIWDGRFNIDGGNPYYINDPSPAYLEAKKWNEENQDKVISYMEWKRGSDVERQRKKADNEYYWRTHPQDASPEKRMARLNHAFDNKEKRERLDARDAIPGDDIRAINDFLRDMDKKKIELEPMSENARRGTKTGRLRGFKVKDDREYLRK